MKFALTIILGTLVFLGRTQGTSNQLLWEISGKGLKEKSYLFGTFHSNDKRLFQFSDSIYFAFIASKAVILEVDLFERFDQLDTRVSASNLRFDLNGNPYTIDPKASATKYGSEDGHPQFMDAYFQLLAVNSNRTVYALESIESQVELFEDLSLTTSTSRLAPVKSYTLDVLLENYLRGDIDNLRQLLMSQLQAFPGAYQRVFTQRNNNMAVGIDSLIRKQSAFIAIGAGHLPGNEGVLQLLRQRGYQVRLVQNERSGMPTKTQPFREWHSYTLADSLFGFRAVFGGKPLISQEGKAKRFVYQELGQGNHYSIEVFPNDSKMNLQQLGEEFFFLPKEKQPTTLTWKGLSVLEGLTEIEGLGFCWRRVFVHKGFVYKLTCFGGNKFMHSDRPTSFFNRVELF